MCAGRTPIAVVDGLLVLLVEGGLHGLFLVVFWRKHGEAVRRFSSRLTGRGVHAA